MVSQHASKLIYRLGRMGGVAATLCVSAVAAAQNGGPVQVGDIAFGLNVGEPSNSAHLVRHCGQVGAWTSFTFMQSMEFDNLNGVPHSACGNLLALDFGLSEFGGRLISLATNGTDNGSVIFNFNGSNGSELTRVGGLSVSPDNARVAVIGYDTGGLNIVDYVAGDGSGNGSANGATAWSGVGAIGATQGTAWLDNNHVLAYTLDPIAGDTKLKIVNVNSGAIMDLASISVRSTPSTFTDVEYNPSVSPYIYCMHSSFSGGTFNTLTVLDTDLNQVKQVFLEGSMETGREIALGGDGLLYLSSYGGSANPGPWIKTISADPNQMSNNGTADCYRASQVTSAFNGIDNALGECGGGGYTCSITGTCPGTVRLEWSGAEPGRQQGILFARNTGNFVIPSGPCQGTQLGLGANQLQLYNTIGTGSGSGGVNAQAGPGACGGYVQLITTSTCATSNVAQVP